VNMPTFAQLFDEHQRIKRQTRIAQRQLARLINKQHCRCGGTCDICSWSQSVYKSRHAHADAYEIDDDEQTFWARVTSDAVDRQGDIVVSRGGDWASFMANPIVTSEHGHGGALPIGKIVEVVVRDHEVLCKFKLAKTTAGKEAFQLVRDGMLNATSLGFDPQAEPIRLKTGGKKYTKWLPLEIALTGVPACQNCLILRGTHPAIEKEFRPEQHPRGGDPVNAGRFSAGWGGRANPRRAIKAKHVARLAKYRDPAVRRRIVHALKNEAELANAVGGYNVPDSWPADVMIVVGADGRLLSADPGFKGAEFLKLRERALDLQRNKLPFPDERGRQLGGLFAQVEGEAIRRVRQKEADALREALSATVVFAEVKTKWTSASDTISMSRKATNRKLKWEQRYQGEFHTVVFDDRRGHKFTGSRLYFKRGVGTAQLSAMMKADSFGAVADALLGGR
jgi:hypothetical protein